MPVLVGAFDGEMVNRLLFRARAYVADLAATSA